MTRDEAIKWLQGIEERYFHGGDEAYDKRRREAVRMAIEALERKHGEWIIQNGMVVCSECFEPNFETNFCPNCGADMRGGYDEKPM